MRYVKRIKEMELREADQRRKPLRIKPKKPNGFSENPTEPKKPDNDNEYDSDNDYDNDLLSKEEKEEKLEQRFKRCLNSQNEELIKECKKYLDKLPYTVINWVLVRTSGIEKPNWNYAKTVLEDFKKRKIDSLNKIQADQERYKTKSKKSRIANFTQREYSKELYQSLYANLGG